MIFGKVGILCKQIHNILLNILAWGYDKLMMYVHTYEDSYGTYIISEYEKIEIISTPLSLLGQYLSIYSH